MKSLPPVNDHAEAVALFRAAIIGPLAYRPLAHGELKAELCALSRQRFRPPGALVTRSFSVPTLERWLYAYRRGGFAALRPNRRRDAGRGRALNAELKQLLLDIRAEHRGASTPIIIRTLILAGVVREGELSSQTLNRLYRQAALPWRPRSKGRPENEETRARLRWQAPYTGALWHGDVCHLLRIRHEDDSETPALVHALLDDHSRYILRLEVRPTEREQDMLELLANTLREHDPCELLYLDNGATYSGEVLPVVCERVGIHLLHAAPGDAAARGKMERLWGTMRRQCGDHIRGARSLHDVFVRLLAWREQYHRAPHSSLLGRSPEQVWREGRRDPAKKQRRRPGEKALREAYVIKFRRRVRKDSTISIDGTVYELDAAWLAGSTVVVARSHLRPDEPYVLHEGRRLALHPVDPVANSRRRRRPPKKPPVPASPPGSRPPALNPAEVALDAMLRRGANDKDSER